MSKNIIAKRLDSIKPSPIMTINAKARALKAQGLEVFNLSVGEPDFKTPQNIVDATKQAMDQGYIYYTACDGTMELKRAIAKKFKRDNGLDYRADQISVGVGAKKVLYNLFMSTIEPDDEVIITAPYWASYPDMIALVGGKSVVCKTNDQFMLEPDILEKAITPRTKWLLLNSPNNPSGVVYTKENLASLAEVLLKHPHVHVVSDDIYEHIIYPGSKFYTMASVEPRLYERVFTVNGVSKAYAMTGWRIGYVGGGNPEIIKAMSKVQSQTITCPVYLSQIAAEEALSGPQDFIDEMNISFQRRRDYVVDAVNKIDGLTAKMPSGAFYLFINCSDLIGKKKPDGKVIADDVEFCEYLLESAYIATVPGTVFGYGDCLRISYATSDEVLHKSCEAMKTACAQLK